MSPFACALIFLGLFVPGIEGRNLSQNTSAAVFLSYNEYNSYAVYEAWRISGELSFLFKSVKSTAFLAYQDDGTYNHFDLFLVNGKVRARVTFNECHRKKLTVDGNFSDSRWHRIRLEQGVDNITLTVDGCFSESISCKYTGPKLESWRDLYVGNIPNNISLNSLANPGIFYEAISFEFQGCIGHVTQTTPGESPKPLALLYSWWTGAHCKSYCSFGGKCNPIDDVTRKECECPGYGNESSICRRYSTLPNVDPRNTVQVSSSTQSHSAPKAFSSKNTPILSYSSQANVKATSSSKTTESSTATRAQSASTHAQDPSGVKAQHADVAVVRQSSSVPGHFSRSKHVVPEHTSSLPPTALFTSSVEVRHHNSVGRDVSVLMAKSSNALRILGSWVLFWLTMTASVVSSLMSQ